MCIEKTNEGNEKYEYGIKIENENRIWKRKKIKIYGTMV